MDTVIIGGADGPTAVFVTVHIDPIVYIGLGVFVVAAIVATVVYLRRKRKSI